MPRRVPATVYPPRVHLSSTRVSHGYAAGSAVRRYRDPSRHVMGSQPVPNSPYGLVMSVLVSDTGLGTRPRPVFTSRKPTKGNPLVPKEYILDETSRIDESRSVYAPDQTCRGRSGRDMSGLAWPARPDMTGQIEAETVRSRSRSDLLGLSASSVRSRNRTRPSSTSSSY